MPIEVSPLQRVSSGRVRRGRNDRSKAGSKPVRRRSASVLRSLKRSLRQVSKGVKNDLNEAKKIWLPWPAVFCLFVLAFVFIRVLHAHGLEYLYRPIWNAVAVFGFLFFLKWRLRRYAWFWITMTAVVALHVLLILVVPWTNKWVPALVTAGIDSLDLCLVFWILGIVEDLAGGPKDNDSET
ncbi:MAG: hypothetical protein WBE72_05110 [Terracidiphilus sp.]